jgi:hypothetical protein
MTMTDCNNEPFAWWSPVYRDQGMWPRPVHPGTGVCEIPGWQHPDAEQSAETLAQWTIYFARHGIGLLMGSPLPDGTRLGAFDVKRKHYIALAKVLLKNPICGRIDIPWVPWGGGAVFFVRYRGQLGNDEFFETGKVAECLFRGMICAIPPTINPHTKLSYQWLGTPLHEVDLLNLPLVEAGTEDRDQSVSLALLHQAFASEHYPRLSKGKGTHNAARNLIAQLVAHTQDAGLLHDVIASGLPANYSGNTLREIPSMIKGALRKGFNKRARGYLGFQTRPAKGRSSASAPSSPSSRMFDDADPIIS